MPGCCICFQFRLCITTRFCYHEKKNSVTPSFCPAMCVSNVCVCVCVWALTEFEAGGQIQQLPDMMKARSSKTMWTYLNLSFRSKSTLTRTISMFSSMKTKSCSTSIGRRIFHPSPSCRFSMMLTFLQWKSPNEVCNRDQSWDSLTDHSPLSFWFSQGSFPPHFYMPPSTGRKPWVEGMVIPITSH